MSYYSKPLLSKQGTAYNTHLTDPQQDYHILSVFTDKDSELKANNIKSTFLRRLIRTITLLIINCFVEGKYLCRFYRKTGTTLAFFVNTKDKAEEYRTWYLSETDMAAKTILITNKRATRLMKEDVEEFEYRKVTIVQKNIIDPVLAFLRQPSIVYLSLRSILMCGVLIAGVVCGYYYFNESYSFIGNGSIKTFNSILDTCTSAISIILVTYFIAAVSSGVLSIRSALSNYYMGVNPCKRTTGLQLIEFALVPVCYSLLIQPSIMILLNALQNRGYFIP